MPNGLPMSDWLIFKHHPQQRAAPVVVKSWGQTVKYIPTPRKDWARTIAIVWAVLLFVIPVVLGIIAWISRG